MTVPDQCFCNLSRCHSDSIISRSFSFNDLISTVSYTTVYFLHFLRKSLLPPQFCKLFHRDPIYIGTTPHCKLTVAMFPDNKSMHISAVNLQFFADQVF